MADTGYICEGCDLPKTERFESMVDHEVCSARCAGRIIAGKKPKTKKHIKHRKYPVKLSRENAALSVEGTDVLTRVVPPNPKPVGFVMNAQDTSKGIEGPGWGVIPFERNVYSAIEITVLVKVHADGQWRVFGNMRNVLAYTDPRLGLLLRPNMSGVSETFDDFPEAARVARVRPANRHKGITDPKEEVKAVRVKAPKPVRAPVVVEGATYGNVCADPGSKRFWLVESMLKGGDSKEIVKRAGKLAKEAGIFEETDFSSMASNPSSIRDMYGWLKQKWNQKGVKGRVTESNGLFHAEVLER